VQQSGKFKGFKGSSKLLGKFKTYKERSRNTIPRYQTGGKSGKTGGTCTLQDGPQHSAYYADGQVQQLGKFKGFKGSSKLLGKFKTYKERSRNTTHKGMQEVLKLCTVN
jgi:hypothetical protein